LLHPAAITTAMTADANIRAIVPIVKTSSRD
jgi:hypothetical protein